MRTLATLAAAALSLGFAGTASAAAPGPQLAAEPSIAESRCRYPRTVVFSGVPYTYYIGWYCR
jgi:hypothetical protein